jgi:hypothetical protein
LGLAALALGALAAFSVLGASGPAGAHAPHTGLEFHIGIDTNGDSADDCSTVGDSADFCSMPTGTMFVVSAYLDSLGDIPGYDGVTVWEDFAGVTAKGTMDSDTDPWPDCVLNGHFTGAGYTVVGCAIGIGAPSSTYTGKVTTATYTCTDDGTITMNHSVFTTSIVDSGFNAHAEAGPDVLTIICQAPSLGGVATYPAAGGDGTAWPIAGAAAISIALLVLGGWAWRLSRLR